ncbi:MAG: ABC transporter substrate-binding protein [Rhodospirillaceae bacterium]|jgi:phospholipid transport system substrate-binding protein|nr:ABC transporter substrate-binding protein [Rhodospirillales bacterium]MBT3904099.1 ABC transporter substrate-binding protein [Rhodospirillaceae bacterium]MBT4699525.1 ABC transporter substrate-binding protein [Rhodospirillaceae bacterium]MBT5035501.1 ABC transporter substrate-binding protein [Rhodospirillaceae bacterium]MBT6219301.1 ABC transporter substrate-binding protein [Rhodospirillaceae bacterium]
MILRRNLIAFAIAVLVATAVAPQSASATSPEKAAGFLTQLANSTVAVLQVKGTPLDVREAKIRDLLRGNFDFYRIGRYVMGRAWRSSSKAQQKEFLGLFRENVLRTYSRRLGGYVGQSFKVVGSQKLGKKDALVRTVISRPSGPPIKAGWRIRETPKGFKILDVMVAGLSMIKTQQSEYASVIKSQGVNGLIESLRLRNTKFAARR